MPHITIAAGEWAKAWATSRKVATSMPQIGAMRSGVKACTCKARASKSRVRSRTKAWFVQPSVMMMCSKALSKATSVSGLNAKWRQAWRARSVRRGSINTKRAPRSTAFLIQVAATGWLALGLAPITTINSAWATSRTGLLTAPEPTPSSNAATLEAWHKRVQWSTLLLPKPVRTNF